jgi:hypothetical protein
MADAAPDLIRLLEAELDFIEGGGYGSPAGEPPTRQKMFDRSPSCINHWLVPGHESECHDDCILLGAVPAEHRNQAMPCHFIPLNEAGETVGSFEEKGDQGKLEAAVKDWLRSTIERLKKGENPLGVTQVKY